ncbi:MAG: thioredoxin fold domain-containing protein [Candidatus Melainabacteria bacterium]|nr:thioredoxin fold domain-containing protein [Candidatus Melainabacteria bacterium]
MQQIKAGHNQTTTIPTGLVVVMLVALTLRIGVKTWDKNHPPSTRSGIAWHDINYLDKVDASSKKLLLIDFSADWCRPCKTMERTTFLNRTVTEMAAKDFEAIKIIDRRAEEDKNPPKIADLYTKYNLYGFPTIVVALPDKTYVDKFTGAKSPKEFSSFLATALEKASKVRAKEAMCDGRFEDALTSLGDYNNLDFEKLGATSISMISWQILSSLHKEEDAKKVVRQAESYVRKKTKIKTEDEWPLPLFRYMLGQYSDKELLEKAKSKDEQTDAHCCIGLKKLQLGEKPQAITNFMTAIRTGYAYGETYSLAQSYLDKLAPEESPNQTK